MSTLVEESKEQLSLLSSPHGASPSSSSSSSFAPSASSAASSSSSSQPPSTASPVSDLQIRPTYQLMFKPRQVESMMSACVSSFLSSKQYDPAETAVWAKELACSIKNQLKELRLPRYKFLVQVIIGENKGAGVRCGARCFWDQTTDKMAQTHFTNDTLFAIVAAFGVYLY